MNNDIKFHSSVRENIENRSLWKAIKELENACDVEGGYKYRDRLTQLATSYSYLVDYMLKGVDDKGRAEMLDSISVSLEEINDSLLRLHLTKLSPDEYYAAVRMRRLRNVDSSYLKNEIDRYNRIESEKELMKGVGDDITSHVNNKYQLLRDYFNYVMTIYDNKEDYDFVTARVTDPEMSFEIGALTVGGIFMGMNYLFHRNGFIALLDIYEGSRSQSLQARALVAIVLLLSLNSRRISRDREIMQRLEMWRDSLLENSRVREVVKAVIRTLQTEKVTAKFNNEVIPEIQKLSPEIMKKMREEGISAEDLEMGNNPEWEEMLHKNGIADKLKELNELQQQGADIMMPAFSNLKNFSFFNRLFSWVVPFSFDYILLEPGFTEYPQSLVSLFSIGDMTCDSDKYSLMFAFSKMPVTRRTMLSAQLEAQFEQMKEQIDDMRLKMSQPEFTSEVERYVKDLYRFFKLYPKGKQFDNPFGSRFRFLDLPVVGEMLSDSEVLGVMSEFYFRNEFYKEALPLFILLSKEEDEATKASLWEKVGYCHHVEGRFADALKYYERAELLKSPGEWLIRKLYMVNKRLGNYDLALPYLQKLLLVNPDDVSLLLQSADLNIRMGKYEEAAEDCHHVDYLKPGHKRAMLLLADAEYGRWNYEKSLELYRNYISKYPDDADYMRAAAAAFLSMKYDEAFEFLRKAAGLGENPATSPKVMELREEIVSRGGNAMDFDILVDALDR